ncbi:serine incorporator 5 isoform X2 [Eurytemora carolleeae]|uniref:serine incorporator 5 isoform X2 n=1 Tax=Eurytemora carolleeae TaxID=1294199 RepID=UPI000C77203B|nr:serine incorporator 5 isoform X2 [Eurytemora carolleeae]|eukprot:XP_023332230.1 serine incorporator 5-like isoform X2 [Eurytemora affinis]
MSTNTIIISCNGSLSLLVLVLTLLPCTNKSTGGFVPALLQSSIVCSYLTFLTWCTVTSTPDSTRDPTDQFFNRNRENHQILAANLGPYHAGLEPYHNLDLELQEECEAPTGGSIDETWIPYTAIIIMFLVLTYSSITSWTSSPAKVLGLKIGETDEDPGLCICCRAGSRRDNFPPGPPAAEKDGGQHVIRNERIQTVYSYSLFHITLCLANMFVTMQLTQWFQPQETKIISFSKSWSTVILKTVSCWVSVLVYLSTLVIPTWRPNSTISTQHGSDIWASEETACLQTSHI